MKKNIGNVDRIIRILVAVMIAGLYFAHVISGSIAMILLAVAGIFIVTGFLSFCPIYWPFGFSTRKKEQE